MAVTSTTLWAACMLGIWACGSSDSTGPSSSASISTGRYELRTSPPFPGYTGNLERVDTLVVTYATPDSIAGHMQGQSYAPTVALGFYNIDAYLIYIGLYSGGRMVGVRITPSPLACGAQFVPTGESFPCTISRIGP
jgi:hypothetical protein